MNIVRVTEYMFSWLGGSSANEYLVCKGLAKLGHQVTLFTSNMAPGRYYLNVKRRGEEFTDGFKIMRMKTIANLGGDMPIMPELMSKMWNVRADIIHAHEFYNYTSIVASFVARKNQIPFTFTQERYYFIKRKIWKLPYIASDKTICSSVRKSAKKATAFTTAAKEFLAKSSYPPERIVVIPMAIDTNHFTPLYDNWLKERLNLGGGPILLSIARLHRSKGLDLLISAMRRIKLAIPDVKLIIIGRGPEEEFLRTLVKKLDLGDSVIILTEQIPNEVMPKIYASCDIVVLPSRYEPFGLAVLEAMACGKPVIASDIGGIRDLIKNGVSGFKIPIGNEETFTQNLAQLITYLLEDSALRKEMGRIARQQAENYDWELIAKRYESFYNQLIKGFDRKSG